MPEPQLQWVLVTFIHLVHVGVGTLKKLGAPNFPVSMVVLGLCDGFFGPC